MISEVRRNAALTPATYRATLNAVSASQQSRPAVLPHGAAVGVRLLVRVVMGVLETLASVAGAILANPERPFPWPGGCCYREAFSS